MKEIKLCNSDKMCLVSDEDYEELSKQEWRYDHVAGGVTTRLIKQGGGVPFQMHRIILKMPMYIGTVDHIDGNRLNNQRTNLRICSQSENLYNSKKRLNTSGYRGVSWANRDKRWVAHVRLKNKTIRLHHSSEKLEPAFAYDCAIRMFGVRSIQNNVDNLLDSDTKLRVRAKVEQHITQDFPDFMQQIKSGY
jgi:HNH endonuclease